MFVQCNSAGSVCSICTALPSDSYPGAFGLSSLFFFSFFLLNRCAPLSNLLFLKPALKCAPSRTFGSHIGIRWVETFSGAVRFSSSELPLQSQSLKASIIRREWRGGGREARGEGVLGSVCITVAKLLCLLNHRVSRLQTSPVTPPLVCSAGFWVTCKKGEK